MVGDIEVLDDVVVNSTMEVGIDPPRALCLDTNHRTPMIVAPYDPSSKTTQHRQYVTAF